jgi:hypothetical protein
MARNDETIASMRCPVCFGREIDVLLLHDGTRYYCVKCSYRGSEEEVRSAYRTLRQKYENRTTRLTIDDIGRL